MRSAPPRAFTTSATPRAVSALIVAAALAAGSVAASPAAQAASGVSATTASAAFETATRLSVVPSGRALAGSPVVITATVGPKSIIGVGPFPGASAYAGTIQFLVDGAALGAPVAVSPTTSGSPVAASLTTSTLPVGTHTLGARYTPTDTAGMTASTATEVTCTIVATPSFPTTLHLSTTPASSGLAGTSVDVIADIDPGSVPGPWSWSGDHSGTVRFLVDGADVATPVVIDDGGRARLSLTDLSVGTHTISAVFTPVAPAIMGASASELVTYTVVSAPSVTTSTKLNVSPGSRARAGEVVVLKAIISPLGSVVGPFAFAGRFAGAVQFRAGTIALGAPVAVNAAGKATLSTTALPTGVTALSAEFIPASPGDLGGSTSASLPYTVASDGLTTSIGVTTAPVGRAKQGKKVTLKATVAVTQPVVGPWVFTGAYTGMVRFFIDGVDTGAVAVSRNGTTSFTTKALPVGTLTITAVFEPDDTTAMLGSVSAPVTFTVAGA